MERVNNSKQKVISSVDLLELLDLEERGDLAEHLDLKRPDKLNDIAFRDKILKISATTLLAQILQLRQPLIRMLQEVYAFLSTRKVKGRSTTRVVILPRAEGDLSLLFDEAMESVIATSLDRCRQKASLEAIAQQIDNTTKLIGDSIGMIAPSFVQSETDASLALGDDPILRGIAPHFWEHKYVYHQHDIELVEDLYRQMEDIATKLELLASTVQRKSSANATVIQDALSTLADEMRIVESKLYDMRGSRPDSWDITSPDQSIYERDWDVLLEDVSVLKETIFAACEFEEGASSLYDFLNLEVWRDRWRIYELWMLTHLMEVLEHVSFAVDISARVTGDVWNLKFTKDKSPIATLATQGVVLDVYYQLYEKTARGGDMPDIAIKERGAGYIFVLDPKYGCSYGRSELSELAARYARAFSAKLTVIHNFYPLPAYDYCTVSENPASLVVSDIAPGTENLRKLDQDIISYLDPSWIGERIVIMVDVSGSTGNVRQRIIGAVEKVCREGKVRDSGNSFLILYSDKIESCLPLSKVDDIRASIVTASGGGTNLTSSLREIADMLVTGVRTPSTILIFTDDDSFELSKGTNDLAAVAQALHSMNVQLKVFEATSSDDTILSAFTKDNQMQYEKL